MEIETDVIVEKQKPKNPFPGLRPFKYEESYLYFGRDKQVGEALQKLIDNRFLGIIGASGTGKSSFVYCGLLYTLLSHEEAGEDWVLISLRPGDSPTQSLVSSLVKALQIDSATTEMQLADYSQQKNALVEVIRENYLYSNKKYLVFIDQFEELFRYRDISDTHRYEVENFINMFVSASLQQEVPIYVALTMRSEFIGDCSVYSLLTKNLNKSQFLIPHMTREEKREAIMQPIAYMEANIDNGLVEKILHDIGESSDQLPLMQHAMMRTWQYWKRNAMNANQPIANSDYEAVGGVNRALEMHANEIFNRFDNDQKKICEKIFKTICEKGAEDRGLRKPTKLSIIADIVGADIETVSRVIEPFRKNEASILMPTEDEPLDADSTIDIAHESLIRIWGTLNTWIDEEMESVKLYLRLAEAAEMHQRGKAGLWRPPDLQLALSWRAEQKPSIAWAARHNPAFERSMLFLDYSEKEYEKEQINKEKLQKARLRQARMIAIASGVAVVICVLFLLYALQKGEEAAESLKAAQIQEKAAKKSAIAAEKAKKVADKEKIKAEASAEEARKASAEALEKRRQALEERKKALEAKLAAEIAETAAQVQKKNALKQAEIANINKQIADINNQLANIEKEKAELARQDVARLRMVSIAKTAAIKSVKIPDNELQGLLAQQAYAINNKYSGKENDPDIYQGLYYAIKNIKSKENPVFNQLNGHKANVRSIQTGNLYMFSASSDGNILAWNLQNVHYTEAHQVKFDKIGQANGVTHSLAVSSDNKYIACGGEYGQINIYEGQNLLYQLPVPEPAKDIWYITFSADAKQLLAIDNLSRVLAWTRNEIGFELNPRVLLKSSVKINTASINPKQNVIVLGREDGKATFIDLQGNELKTIDVENSPITSMCFSPSGRKLATGCENGMLKTWDSQTYRQLADQKEHRARINCMVYDRTGEHLATASFDRTVRIWNANDLNELPIILDDHNDWVWSIAFSADNKNILAGCRDNMIRVWSTQVKDMKDIICRDLNGANKRKTLTNEEWGRFIQKLEGSEKPDCTCCQ